MKIQTKRHVLYYIFMAVLLSVGVFLGFQTTYNRQLQFQALLLTSIAYVMLGIFHHIMEHDITLKIVIEYVLIGLLGVVLVLTLIKGL